MAGFFSGAAKKGILGGPLGAYGANKGFRSGVNSFLFGEKPHIEQIENQSPEQKQALSQILGMLNQSGQPGGAYNQAQNYYSNLLQPGSQAYDQFSQPYLQQFEQQILPMIAERYAGAGALSSSGFGQAVGGAGAGLQANLAQLFSQLQGQAAQGATSQFGQLGQLGLGTSAFTNYENPGHQGFGAQLLAALIKGGMGGIG
jgi:hypothetical protein